MSERRISRARIERRSRKRRRFLLAIALAAVAWSLFRGAPHILSALGRFFHVPVRRVILNDPDFSHLFGHLAARENNMLTLRLEEIAALAAHHPAIGSVSVSRSYPDTILVSIYRRAPFAVVHLAEGGQLVVDRAGIPLETDPAETPAQQLPAVTDLSREELPDAIPEIVQIHRTFLFYKPVMIEISEKFFTLRRADGAAVRVPFSNYAFQSGLLKRILADFARKEVRYKYIDLRFSEPVFLPEKSPRPARRRAG